MNKLSLVLATALFGAVALGAPVPRAEASATSSATAPAIQTLDTGELSPTQFNALFTPYNTPILSPFAFSGTASGANSGMIESQVFRGNAGTAAAGLYAYAYQVAVSGTPDANGVVPHVDSTSFTFPATPVGKDLTGAGETAYGYTIANGSVGGLNLSGTQTPTTLSWQPATTTGFIRAQYVDPASQTAPLNVGNNSATFVLMTQQLPASVTPSVNVGAAAATTTVPVAYSATPGTISAIPIPEPATVLAWSGMVAAVALVRRVRKARSAAVAAVA